ncbi:MAG: S8 family peptidase [Ferruginibacter sp.]
MKNGSRPRGRIMIFITLGLICFMHPVQGQSKQFTNKLSPQLALKLKSDDDESQQFLIMVSGNALPASLSPKNYKAQKIVAYTGLSFYTIQASLKVLMDSVLTLPAVLFAEDATRKAMEETLVNNLDLGTNKINVVHSKFPQWNGEGLTVSVKEDRPDTTDIDFAGRYLPTTLSSAIRSSHANNMATMIAGAGNSWYWGKGAAWGSIISSSNFANLLPDPLPVLQQYNITVQNHSYGVGIENFYGADASVYDANMITNPVLMNVFSSGNSGTLASTTGRYSGIAGFANLTGSFKMAKNIITVGATDSFSNVASLSSKGPAFDGRVKPELTAFGIDGSSGAAALVSGVSLILQQAYKQLNGTLPPSALLKAILLNSADDRGNPGVDYSNGYGSLNALNAIRTIQSSRFFIGSVANNTAQNFTLTIPPGIRKIKLTLVWNDPAAAVNATKALVNDLDLELQNNSTSQTWKPWVLNSYPHKDSLMQLASRKRDSLNNTEQITLDNPLAGNYTISVKGFSIPAGTQTFYIAYQLDSTGVFEWHYPMAADPVFTASANTLRWQSSYPSATGGLEYSVDNGATWQLINPAVDLAAGYYNWNAPPVIKTSILKMTIGASQFSSDTFVIAARTVTGVGFNCPDSFLFYWKKLPAVNNYRFYKLGSRYMEPMLTTTDSFVVLQKAANPSLYYAVAPMVNGKEGLRSYTINYTIQGVGCYFRSFFATLVNDAAVLPVSLGSLYNVNKIVLEKWDGINFRPIQQLTNNNSLMFDFTDNALSRGLNIYRIKLEFAGGGFVYSLIESVFYFGGSSYVVYPNPAAQYRDIHIAQEHIDIAIMQVFNVMGSKVFEMQLDDRINTIPAGKLSKGVYFIRIINNGKRQETLKLLVI